MDTLQALTKCFKAMAPDVRRATVYLSPKLVVSLCRRHKYHKRNTREDLVAKIGVPNYLETRFIAKCRAAGEPFPIKKVQLKTWPAGKKAI